MKKEFKRLYTGISKQCCMRFNKQYLKNKIKNRTGKCKKCGACCRGCWFLDKKTKLCRIYNKRSGIFCYKEFPLDKSDQKLWDVEKVCGYKFKE